jgi:DNA (cytosine-5)-methyltransferase 1
MNAADYFCGAGGASQGLHDAGYDVIGFDYWARAVETHNANGLPANLHDLSDATLDDLLPRVPFAWFSPPCQAFSAAGDGAGEFDERDGFPWALRILRATLPDVAIFENVKGVTFEKHASYFRSILAAIGSFGYRFDWRVLNCADVGVPQTRERCFIVCRRDGGPITWPTVTHTEHEGLFTAKWVSMADALGWGATTMPFLTVAGCNTSGGFDPWGVGGSGARDRLRCERDAGRWVVAAGNDANATRRPIDQSAPTVLARKDPNGWVVNRPATTIQGDTRVWPPGHNINGADIAAGRDGNDRAGSNAIRLTIPELARLQDFPDGWVWCGNKTEQARQVGNAVPRTMARLLGEANRPVAA